MNTVELLHRYLDDNPTDRAALLALADAVEESGGPGLGWQVISRSLREPCDYGMGDLTKTREWTWYAVRGAFGGRKAWCLSHRSELPDDWFDLLDGDVHRWSDWWRDYPTRRAALEAAALAFAKLPESRQSELLAVVA